MRAVSLPMRLAGITLQASGDVSTEINKTARFHTSLALLIDFVPLLGRWRGYGQWDCIHQHTQSLISTPLSLTPFARSGRASLVSGQGFIEIWLTLCFLNHLL